MEQMESKIGRPQLVGQTCSICTHPDRDELNRLMVEGVTLSHIARRYGSGEYRADRWNLERHLANCIRSTTRALREQNRIAQATDVDRHFDFLLDEAREVLFSAKSVLLVDGELDLNPREHEVNIVYRDHNDTTEQGQPKIKTALLSKLLARIASEGYEPMHSYIKAEDARKGLRDAIALCESIVDRKARMTGAYQQDRRNQLDEAEELRKLAMRNADKLGTSYAIELNSIVQDYGHRLTPTLRGTLLKECLDTFDPLPARGEAGFLPSPVIEISAETMEVKVPKNGGNNSQDHDEKD